MFNYTMLTGMDYCMVLPR